MSRVIWDDEKKNHRLSAAARELLARMCSDGVPIRYEFRAGKYTRTVNGALETVQERTVETLVRAGVIARLKDNTPSYAANERAREFFKRMEEAKQMTNEEIKALHRENARVFNEQAERDRAARRDRLEGKPLLQPAKPEIKAPAAVSALPSQNPLKVNQSTKGESTMSTNQPKPEPPVTVIAEKARDYQKQQHAKGNRFYSIAEAVNHVRQEMGLSNDTLATDADMTQRAHAQQD